MSFFKAGGAFFKAGGTFFKAGGAFSKAGAASKAGTGTTNGRPARGSRRLRLMVVGTLVLSLVDLVLAGTLPSGLSGHGWAWPGAAGLVPAALGAVVDPRRPLSGWAAQRRPVATSAVAFWSSAACLFGGQVGVASYWLRRAEAASQPSRRRLGVPAVRHPLPDGRDRHGFAGYGQLRREASVGAARRRACQTRPSLASSAPRRLSPDQVGYPLGWARRGRLPLRAHWEASLRLVAPPGEGKTFRVLAPILRQHPGPAVATSTKPDIYELTALARQRRGPVFAMDPDAMVPSAAPVRWSPVDGCSSSEVAERRAAAFVAAVGDDKDGQNSGFFRDSARDLLKAYLHAAALEGLDLRSVLAWSRRPDDPEPGQLLASHPAAAPGWADLVEVHTTGAEETTSGVMRYVARALACFSHESILATCCPGPGDGTRVEDVLAAGGTFYLLGKGSRLGAVAPLVTAFADEVFDTAERLASVMPTRRLDPPLLGLLDEAPNIAPLPSLPELLADGRGRGIVVVYAMQSFSQAVTRWGEKKTETMGNATTITAVMGGLTSSSDLTDLERLCGQRKVKQTSVSRSMAGRNGGDYSRSISWAHEPVLRADQIRTLPSGTALLFWGKLPPFLAEMPLLSETSTWPEIRSDEMAARLANDRARQALAVFGPARNTDDPTLHLDERFSR